MDNARVRVPNMGVQTTTFQNFVMLCLSDRGLRSFMVILRILWPSLRTELTFVSIARQQWEVYGFYALCVISHFRFPGLISCVSTRPYRTRATDNINFLCEIT